MVRARNVVIVAALLGVVGCASDNLYVAPQIPAAQAVTLKGPVSSIDGRDVPQKALGFADPDPMTLAPGTHVLGLWKGDLYMRLPLHFRPGQAYELKFDEMLGLSPKLTIRNLTAGRVYYFDPIQVLIYDKDGKVQPTNPPFAP